VKNFLSGYLDRRKERDDDGTIAVCQIPGRWHTGEEDFEDATQFFEQRGHPVVTTSLPIEKRNKSYDDFAKSVCRSIIKSGFKRFGLVGWSLGGNTAPRVEYLLKEMTAAKRLSEITVSSVVFVAGVAEPRTLPWVDRAEAAAEPEKNSLYVKAIVEHYKKMAQNVYVMDPITARDTIYKDCTNEVAIRAISKMRRQWLYEKAQPPVRGRSDTPWWYLFCENDYVVDHGSYQPYVQQILRIPDEKTYTFKGCGHAPHRSRPEEYANVISDVIENPEVVL
jgi:pimeloyl-ACP methyl ester carboxylesterase